jgi:glyoxylase-like metal-dependent hydrolase (beta-lactamase superfamily II)
MRRFLVLSAAAALATAAYAAVTHGPVPAVPAAEAMQLGDLKLVMLRDAGFQAPNDGTVFGLNASVEAVTALLAAAGVPTDRVSLSLQALLVKLPTGFVLIDTGLGPKFGGRLLESLTLTGIPPEAIGHIFISHSHFDHAGGLVDANGQPQFPKAVIHMAADEWAFLQANKDNAALAAAIAPQVKTFTGPGPIIPGIAAEPNPGHTPGHSTYRVTMGSTSILALGDTAHSYIVSVGRPDWTIAYDTDKPKGAAVRRATLAALAKSGANVWSPHFPYPGVGTVVVKGDGYAWVPNVAAPPSF